MLVLLEMAVEVGLLAETAVAQVTLEGFLLVVDVANVALKIGRDTEGAVTVFTPGEGGGRRVNGGGNSGGGFEIWTEKNTCRAVRPCASAGAW